MRQQHLAPLLLAICAASSSYAAPVSNRNARLLGIARELIDVVFDAADAQKPVTPEPVRVTEGNTLGCWDSSTKKWFRCWTADTIASPENHELTGLGSAESSWDPDDATADQIESTQRPTRRIESNADDLDDYSYYYEEFGDYDKGYDADDNNIHDFDDLWRPFPGLRHEFTDLGSVDQTESTQRPTPRILSDADDLDDYFNSYEEFEKWYDKIHDADDNNIDDFDDFQHPFPGLRHELTDLEPFPFDDDVTELMYLNEIDRPVLHKSEDNPQDSEPFFFLSYDDDQSSFDDDYYYNPDWEPGPDDVAVRRVLSDKDRQPKASEK